MKCMKITCDLCGSVLKNESAIGSISFDQTVYSLRVSGHDGIDIDMCETCKYKVLSMISDFKWQGEKATAEKLSKLPEDTVLETLMEKPDPIMPE